MLHARWGQNKDTWTKNSRPTRVRGVHSRQTTASPTTRSACKPLCNVPGIGGAAQGRRANDESRAVLSFPYRVIARLRAPRMRTIVQARARRGSEVPSRAVIFVAAESRVIQHGVTLAADRLLSATRHRASPSVVSSFSSVSGA